MAYLEGVRMSVVYANLLRISFEEFEIGSIGVKYRVEPGSFLDNINRQRREYDSGLVRQLRTSEATNQSALVESLRAQLSPRGTDIGLDELLKTEALVDRIGGDAKVAGYCLDAIRACHVYRVPSLEMMDEAVRAGTPVSEIDLERPDTLIGYKAKRVDFELG